MERQLKLAELDERISHLELQLEPYSSISLLNVKVSSDKYGDGIIIDQKGSSVTVLFEELKKDYISGVTFSGGDPLHEKTGKRSEKLAEDIRENFQIKLFGCIPVMNGRKSVVFHFFPILM